MRLLHLLCAVVIFTSCNGVKNNSQPGTNTSDTIKPVQTEKEKIKPGRMVGGPCRYKHDTVPAKLLRIVNSGNQYNALFAVKRCDDCKTDTITHYISNNQYSKAEEKAKVDTGKLYQFIIQSIVSGTCTPTIEHVNLEAYER